MEDAHVNSMYMSAMTFFTVGLLVLWIVFCIHSVYYGGSEDIHQFIAGAALLPVVTILLSCISLYRGWVAKGLVSLLIGICALIYSMGAITDLWYYEYTFAIIAPFIAMCSLFLLRCGEYSEGSASMLFALGAFTLLSEDLILLTLVLLSVSAVLYISSFLASLLYLYTGRDLMLKERDRGYGLARNPYEVLTVVGFTLSAVVLLIEGVSDMVLEDDYVPVIISYLVISSINFGISVICFVKRYLVLGLFLLFSVSYIVWSLLLLTGEGSMSYIVDVTLAVPCLVLIPMLLRARSPILLLAAFVVLGGLCILPNLDGIGFVLSAGAVSLVLAVVFAYYALAVLLIVETRREVLPLLERRCAD